MIFLGIISEVSIATASRIIFSYLQPVRKLNEHSLQESSEERFTLHQQHRRMRGMFDKRYARWRTGVGSSVHLEAVRTVLCIRFR